AYHPGERRRDDRRLHGELHGWAGGELGLGVCDGQPAGACTLSPLAARLLPGSRRGVEPRDPLIDQLLQERERHAAVLEHHRMEVPEVEPRTKRSLCLTAQLQDLELAYLVGARLAGHGHVALDLRGRVRL